MTDQPSTQERGARCVTCGAYHTHLNPPLNVEEGNAPAVGDGTPDGQATPSNDPAKRASSTTQEAEKALETLDVALRQPVDLQMRERALAALRSLRVQHTEMQERIGELERERESWLNTGMARGVLERARLEAQSAKDREEIERLKAETHMLVQQLDKAREDRTWTQRTLRARHTKDRERIADLERVLASLGQLTAGGSGDAAGSEVE